MYNPFKKKEEQVSAAKTRFEKESQETQVILSSNRAKNDKINEILTNLHKKRQGHVTR
tara:strand:+ start:317 stop:490 length:174 start_codon:yes stop_codon:yes gene_type:complete